MKYLLVDNEVIAKRKSNEALLRKRPNRDALQAQKHAENPAIYAATCVTQYLNGWQKDELGRCEIEMPDEHAQHYPDDNPGKITNVRALQAVGSQK